MSGLLEGVKVVAFDQVVALPATTAVMADWGADVIKIEPVWGDWQRSLVNFNRTPLIMKNENGDTLRYTNRQHMNKTKRLKYQTYKKL